MVNHGRLLFSILDLILHGWVLLDLELDLALLLQLRQNHESLIIVSVVDKSTDLLDLLLSFNGLIDLVDAQLAVDVLLGTIRQGLHFLEVYNSWLHVEGLLLLLLLLELHSHQLVLHLHELVGNHSKLLILWIISTSLWVEVHHQIHLRVHVVHTLTWEAHLILHHHTWELVHILHFLQWSRHLVVHTVVAHL